MPLKDNWQAGEPGLVSAVNAGATKTNELEAAIEVLELGGLNAEAVRDVMGAALVAGAGITITVNDPGDTITIAATAAPLDAEAVRDVVGAAMVAGTGVSVTVNDAADTITISSSVTKADIGLGNVNNTSDAAKPVSTAQQAALDAKLNIADSPWSRGIYPRVVWTGSAWPSRASVLPAGYTGPVEYWSPFGAAAAPVDRAANDLWTRVVA